MNPKKIIVGALAVISTIISALLWTWFSTIPTFEKVNKEMGQIESTFKNASFDDKGELR